MFFYKSSRFYRKKCQNERLSWLLGQIRWENSPRKSLSPETWFTERRKCHSTYFQHHRLPSFINFRWKIGFKSPLGSFALVSGHLKTALRTLSYSETFRLCKYFLNISFPFFAEHSFWIYFFKMSWLLTNTPIFPLVLLETRPWRALRLLAQVPQADNWP